MLYGKVSLIPSITESASLNLLKKVIGWEGCIHHKVEYENFVGGIFLDSRLPHTVDDCLYVDTSHDLLVLMSGYIYNRTEIGREFNIVTDLISDPTLVAHAYLQRGPDFVNNLNGDFSIVIYQPSKNTLFLFRDHVGIRPLAYTLDQESLYFSSDIIGLCRAFYKGGRMSMDPVISIYKPVDMSLTPNDLVLKLKPGHFLEFNAVGTYIKKYWVPERVQTDKTLTQERMLSELKSLLENAVHIRSDQRFKAGAHLSGGLDSSTVAVLARKEYQNQEDFYGYSWSPADFIDENIEFDERDLIKKTCEMAKMIPVFLNTEHDDFMNSMKNSINNFKYFFEEKVLEKAKHHKTNLIFSGWGGDEFLSFGSMGVDSDLVFNFHWGTFLKKNPLSNPKKILKFLIWRVFLPAFNVITPAVKKSYSDALYFFKKEHRKFHQKTFKSYHCYRSRREYHLGLLYCYHIPERTECWSIMGYKNGVEYRYPLLDKRIIEYMLKVPSKVLVKDSKYTRIILREISEGLLPEAVRWRVGKRDHAFFALVRKPTLARDLRLMDEVEEFKTNQNLYFINFDLLEKEIKKFRENNNSPKSLKLCGDISAFKMYHEFTKSYQEKITDKVHLSSTEAYD